MKNKGKNTFDDSKQNCCRKFINQLFPTGARKEAHKEVVEVFSYENFYKMHHKVLDMEQKLEKYMQESQCNSRGQT